MILQPSRDTLARKLDSRVGRRARRKGADDGPNGDIAGNCDMSVWDCARLALPSVRFGSGWAGSFDPVGCGTADLEQDGRMGNTRRARPAHRSECGLRSRAAYASGSSLVAHQQDRATVRSHGSCRPIDLPTRWRRTRGKQRNSFNCKPRLGKRDFPSITLSAAFVAHPQ